MKKQLYCILDKTFASLKDGEAVIVRIEEKSGFVINLLREYCHESNITADFIFNDDIEEYNGVIRDRKYFYFISDRRDNFLYKSVNQVLSHKKKINKAYKIDTLIKNGNWKIVYIPNLKTEKLPIFLLPPNLEYKTLSRKCFPLYAKLMHGERISIKGEKVDLTFSYKRNSVFTCFGEHNLPDGEIGVIPDIYSANGIIQFSEICYNAIKFHDVNLMFKNGKCKLLSCSDFEQFSDLLIADNYSGFLGEFAFGLNPFIIRKTGITLVDEKMLGTYHLALGGVVNGVESTIHLDMISDENSKDKITVDGETIFENGRFCGNTLAIINAQFHVGEGEYYDKK